MNQLHETNSLEDFWIGKYQKANAFWEHDGNPRRPHALLTSGNHSSGFFNSRPVVNDDALRYGACADLIELLIEEDMPISRGTVVVGPQTGATLLAENFAQLLREEYGFPIFSASPAKHGEGENKQMLFTPEEKDLLLGHEVLSIEDVITTGGSIELATQAVVNAGGIALPFVFTLVNRSGLTTVDGKRIIALINRHLPIWTPNECPLCKQGSKAVRAKDNWVLLTANYK